MIDKKEPIVIATDPDLALNLPEKLPREGSLSDLKKSHPEFYALIEDVLKQGAEELKKRLEED